MHHTTAHLSFRIHDPDIVCVWTLLLQSGKVRTPASVPYGFEELARDGWTFLQRADVPRDVPALAMGVPVVDERGTPVGILTWTFDIVLANPHEAIDTLTSLGVRPTDTCQLSIATREPSIIATVYTRTWSDAMPLDVCPRLRTDVRVRGAFAHLYVSPTLTLHVSES